MLWKWFRKCSVSQEKIEIYLNQLLPAYRFSLLYQRNKCHTGDVLPGLLLLIEQYKSVGKKMANLLKWLKKFTYIFDYIHT